nr:reverse transcriptase domain-containing protein [Tanacetum cinerariifolium]
DAPILVLPEGSDDFVVYCDASIRGLGAVLMQRTKVISYASRKLKAQQEAVKTENIEAEDIGGMLKKLEARADGMLCLDNKKHQKPTGLLVQPDLLEWKWEKITMDFITKLPRTAVGFDTIWVTVDCLTKSAHFLPIKESDSTKRLARLYLREIVSKHGVPLSIISDHDSHFTSTFWQSLKKALGTQLDLSTAYHPQTDGQSERTKR